MPKTAFVQWLEDQFYFWQAQQGYGTITGFAAWLGVSRNTYNNWASRGQIPSEVHLRLLAEALGPEVYDMVGIPRPDPRLQTIIGNWGQLPENTRELLAGAASGQQQVVDILQLAAQLTDEELDAVVAFLAQQMGQQIG